MSDNDIVQDFLVESSENLDRLDRDLVGLEKNPRDKDALAGVFRTIHTIKGTCGFLGFTKLEKVVHVGENLLTRLRDGQIMLNPEITTALLSMVDAVRQMLKEIQLTGSDGKLDYPELRETLTRLQSVEGSAKGKATTPKKQAQCSDREAPPVEAAESLPPKNTVSEKSTSIKAEESPSQPNVETAPRANPKPEAAPAVDHAPAPTRIEETVATLDAAKPENAVAAPLGSEAKQRDAAPETIRVGVNLLDKLMTLVGELVLARNQLLQLANTLEDGGLHAVSQRMNLIATTGKFDRHAEEGWTLMPDGSILTYDVTKAPHSERYLPTQDKWISAGSTIVDLHSPTDIQGCIPYGKHGCYYPPGEVGPGILQPDGTVFAAGSASNNGTGPGHTAVYHPGKKITDPGKWTVGPDFPNGDNAGDSYAALLPNGHPIVVGGSGASYEFDGKKLIPGPFLGYFSSLLILPTGELLVAGSKVYTASGKPDPAWAPSVTQYPKTVTRGSTYPISGKQFNGLSQAAAFGDELETATNYPLVRITNKASHHVFYAKTHDHSTMAVATGSATVSTMFDVPVGVETGASSLEVVANGIPSKKVNLTVN